VDYIENKKEKGFFKDLSNLVKPWFFSCPMPEQTVSVTNSLEDFKGMDSLFIPVIISS